MELNSILDWAILFSVIQLNVWQILHIRKSVTTWNKFKQLDDMQRRHEMLLLQIVKCLEKLEERCPPTHTDA